MRRLEILGLWNCRSWILGMGRGSGHVSFPVIKLGDRVFPTTCMQVICSGMARGKESHTETTIWLTLGGYSWRGGLIENVLTHRAGRGHDQRQKCVCHDFGKSPRLQERGLLGRQDKSLASERTYSMYISTRSVSYVL